jgi:peptide deformylase
LAILPILKYPDPRLRMISEPVTDFGDDLAALAEDMRLTMLAAPGAGLAAPQVGRLARLVVVDWSGPDEEYGQNVVTLVNPVIVAAGGRQIYEEGCLSVTDLSAIVDRAASIEIEALDLAGRPLRLSADGRRAVIVQHELDHLDGVLFLDHLSRLKRELYDKRIAKAAKRRRP